MPRPRDHAAMQAEPRDVLAPTTAAWFSVAVRILASRRLVALSTLGLAAGWIAGCSSRDQTGAAASPAEDQRAATPPATGAAGETGSERGSRPRHALVVGGTGMLRDVSLELARRGTTTSVIARSRAALQELVQESGGLVNPISVDYGETDRLIREIEGAIAAHGPIALVVAWIHSDAPEAPLAVARTAAAGGHELRYVHVLGSAADDPAQPDDARRARFAAVAGLVYQEVVLGFVLERGNSRWLTHDEIAAGVLAAVDNHAPRSIVGTTRPWSARP
jgi:hypothetical protein